MSITWIRQDIISLAVRNHPFQHLIESRLTVRVISPVAIRTKRVHFLHRLCTKSTHQRSRSLFWRDRRTISLTTGNTWDRRRWLDKHQYLLASWFRGHILDWIQFFPLYLLSFRIRCTVVSNSSLYWSRVRMQMSCELIPMEVSRLMN